ncbi:hypothetical protein C4D60_Mb10t06140 [Musa balbisiana]|uniref:Uncharacterized protein n=1 Tax=Musa balbisiana TaxID=52838 RepID=A0A4S8IV12_MUSBA|nr:hypothetical protein C4D60_Mb10t06140 [Musa balbisiana]
MGRPAKDEIRCKRHPKHRQSVGVCPFCLRERLSHLTHPSSSSSAVYLSSSSASSSPYSTSDSDLSSYASTPPHHCDKKARDTYRPINTGIEHYEPNERTMVTINNNQNKLPNLCDELPPYVS